MVRRLPWRPPAFDVGSLVIILDRAWGSSPETHEAQHGPVAEDGGMSTRTGRGPAAVAIALLAALALAACGESQEDQARDQVCDARADIDRQVKTLQGLTPSTVTVDAVRESVEAITNDLDEIRDAQGDLGEERRKEVEAATDEFAAEVGEVGSTILRSTSVDEARSQLGAAADQLAESYRTTLGAVDCG
jgi:hypothetical protein